MNPVLTANYNRVAQLVSTVIPKCSHCPRLLSTVLCCSGYMLVCDAWKEARLRGQWLLDCSVWTAKKSFTTLRQVRLWTVRLLLLVVLMADNPPSPPALAPQGWSQMTPVRSVLKMPWCLTAARRRLTAAPRRRMECGSAGRVMHTRTRVSLHALFCRFSMCTLAFSV